MHREATPPTTGPAIQALLGYAVGVLVDADNEVELERVIVIVEVVKGHTICNFQWIEVII